MKATIIIALFFGAIFTSNGQYLAQNQAKSNPTEINNSLEKLSQLVPVAYNYDGHKYVVDKKKYGFLVENVQEIFPELVFTRSVNYSAGKNYEKSYRVKEIENESLIPIMVASIKELQAEIEKLKNEILALKTEANQKL
jgi:Chaperone of endosialidase